MLKNLLLTFFLIFGSFISIYPSKKENTNFIDYCHSLEKILSRNSLEKNKKFLKNYNTFAKDISLFSTKKTKGALVNNIIDQYKSSKKSFIVNSLPNKLYCLGGYWIEEINPGTFQSLFYEKSKQRINQYKNIKKEFDVFLNEINSEYKSIKKEIKDFF